MLTTTSAAAFDLTKSELETAILFFALCGGVERNERAIQRAICELECALPPVPAVDALIASIVNGDVHASSFTPSSGASSPTVLQSVATSSSPSFPVFPAAVPVLHSKNSISLCLTQEEWLYLIRGLKQLYTKSQFENDSLTEERDSFSAIATSLDSARRKSRRGRRMSSFVQYRTKIDGSGEGGESSHSRGSAAGAEHDEEESEDVSHGVISGDKLQRICRSFGLTFDVVAFFNALDENGDGSVDFNEYLALVCSSDDTVEAHLPAFVACGGREYCVDHNGFLKPPAESTATDETALLVPTKSVRQCLPFLPSHIIDAVPPHRGPQQITSPQSNRESSTSQSSSSQKPHASPTTTSKGGFGNANGKSNRGGGAAAAQLQQSLLPYDCDPQWITLNRFVEMIRRWRKSPREVNGMLHEYLQRRYQEKPGTGGGSQQGPGVNVRGDKTNRDNDNTSITTSGHQSRELQLLAKLAEQGRPYRRFGGSDFDSDNDDDVEEVDRFLMHEDTASGDIVSAVKVAQQAQKMDDAAIRAGLESSCIGAKSTAAAVQRVVTRHQMKIDSHRQDPQNEVFEEIPHPPRMPRFSPKRSPSDREALHTPKRLHASCASSSCAVVTSQQAPSSPCPPPRPPSSSQKVDGGTSSSCRRLRGPSESSTTSSVHPAVLFQDDGGDHGSPSSSSRGGQRTAKHKGAVIEKGDNHKSKAFSPNNDFDKELYPNDVPPSRVDSGTGTQPEWWLKLHEMMSNRILSHSGATEAEREHMRKVMQWARPCSSSVGGLTASPSMEASSRSRPTSMKTPALQQNNAAGSTVSGSSPHLGALEIVGGGTTQKVPLHVPTRPNTAGRSRPPLSSSTAMVNSGVAGARAVSPTMRLVRTSSPPLPAAIERRNVSLRDKKEPLHSVSSSAWAATAEQTYAAAAAVGKPRQTRRKKSAGATVATSRPTIVRKPKHSTRGKNKKKREQEHHSEPVIIAHDDAHDESDEDGESLASSSSSDPHPHLLSPSGAAERVPPAAATHHHHHHHTQVIRLLHAVRRIQRWFRAMRVHRRETEMRHQRHQLLIQRCARTIQDAGRGFAGRRALGLAHWHAQRSMRNRSLQLELLLTPRQAQASPLRQRGDASPVSKPPRVARSDEDIARAVLCLDRIGRGYMARVTVFTWKMQKEDDEEAQLLDIDIDDALMMFPKGRNKSERGGEGGGVNRHSTTAQGEEDDAEAAHGGSGSELLFGSDDDGDADAAETAHNGFLTGILRAAGVASSRQAPPSSAALVEQQFSFVEDQKQSSLDVKSDSTDVFPMVSPTGPSRTANVGRHPPQQDAFASPAVQHSDQPKGEKVKHVMLHNDDDVSSPSSLSSNENSSHLLHSTQPFTDRQQQLFFPPQSHHHHPLSDQAGAAAADDDDAAMASATANAEPNPMTAIISRVTSPDDEPSQSVVHGSKRDSSSRTSLLVGKPSSSSSNLFPRRTDSGNSALFHVGSGGSRAATGGGGTGDTSTSSASVSRALLAFSTMYTQQQLLQAHGSSSSPRGGGGGGEQHRVSFAGDSTSEGLVTLLTPSNGALAAAAPPPPQTGGTTTLGVPTVKNPFSHRRSVAMISARMSQRLQQTLSQASMSNATYSFGNSLGAGGEMGFVYNMQSGGASVGPLTDFADHSTSSTGGFILSMLNANNGNSQTSAMANSSTKEIATASGGVLGGTAASPEFIPIDLQQTNQFSRDNTIEDPDGDTTINSNLLISASALLESAFDIPIHTSLPNGEMDPYLDRLRLMAVLRGYLCRKQMYYLMYARLYAKPIKVLQRMCRGFKARRRLGQMLWAQKDAHSAMQAWTTRCHAAVAIQNFIRRCHAKEVLKVKKRKSVLRIELRVVSEKLQLM